MSYSDNSRAQGDSQYVEERPGHITSDSLAAESLKNDGSFAANQAGVSYSSQPSKSTTANNRDTSGATILSATSDSTSRLPQGNYSSTDYQTPSETSDGRYTGASGDNASTAPGYTGNRGLTGQQSQPRGNNLHEGGDITGREPNASFNNDIGGRNDPGRYAEQGYASAASRSGADAGYPGAKNAAGSNNQGGFENLGRDASA